jgi:hypothetical protein
MVYDGVGKHSIIFYESRLLVPHYLKQRQPTILTAVVLYLNITSWKTLSTIDDTTSVKNQWTEAFIEAYSLVTMEDLYGLQTVIQPDWINGVRFYDCCSNINCRLNRSKKASNINFTWILTDFP